MKAYGWFNDLYETVKDSPAYLHALRELDDAQHHTDSPECWCNPDIEEQENGDLLVIHRDKSEAN